MICPYCNQTALFCENKEIYGRNFGNSYMCYYCKPCNAYVGTHQNTTRPLGTMANAELREWRKKTHTTIDPLWRNGKMTRKDLYNKLDQHFKKKIHVGESDIEMCQKIIEFIEK